jgi:hemoglobin
MARQSVCNASFIIKKEFHMTAAATLYQRLGGADGIARLVDDIIDTHLANPLVKTRFEKITDMAHIKKLSREFLTTGSGGPQIYSGKGMVAAHKGMNVSEQEFLVVVDDILAVLNKNSIDADSQKDVLAILYSLNDQIIRV